MFEVSLRVNVMRLYNGRRSFYAAVQLGRRAWFVSRWDTARVTLKPGQHVNIWRGPLMQWYAGIHVS